MLQVRSRVPSWAGRGFPGTKRMIGSLSMRYSAAAALASFVALSAFGQTGEVREVASAHRGRAMILEPVAPLSAADRAGLSARGISVRHAMPGGRYLVRAQEDADLSDGRIRSIRPLTAQLKIDASAMKEAGRGATWAKLNAIFHRDVPFAEARDALLRSGALIERPLATGYSPSRRIEIRLSPASLEGLASDERVLAITGRRDFELEEHNLVSAGLSHVSEVHEPPYGLSGQGVVVSVSELSRADTAHPEFGGRLSLNPVPLESDFAGHPTHVAGTIGAAGVRPEAKGMAPEVNILQVCARCGFDNGVWLDLKESELQKAGVVADNNSWGFILGWRTFEDEYPLFLFRDQYYGAYDLVLAAPLDEISIERGILFVHSAGNDGDPPVSVGFGAQWFPHRHIGEDGDAIEQNYCYSIDGTGNDCPVGFCSGTDPLTGQPAGCEVVRHHSDPPYPFDTMNVTASAKNVIAVGAVTGDGEIASFSSQGPAKDGRVKPDLVARGVGVISSTPSNQYATFSGTSMAAPVVTGIAALLTEQWKRTFRSSPKPEHIKALLLFGAEDLGNPGPDYTYGFGLVDARRSAEALLLDAGEGRRVRTLSLETGAAEELLFSLSQPQDVRLLLNWPDPPIPFLPSLSDIAAKALVNDLDLSVIDPAGSVIRPWVLDRSNHTADATRGINTVDNVEMLEIANAGVGTYRVRVAGTAVAEGPQTVVLVSSADLACLDDTESNDSPGQAWGNLIDGQKVYAAICTEGDVDYFKFVATKAGPVSVTIIAGDTPLRATLSGTGISLVREVAANATEVLEASAGVVPASILLRIEATGSIGASSRYSVTPSFGEISHPRRRSVRH